MSRQPPGSGSAAGESQVRFQTSSRSWHQPGSQTTEERCQPKPGAASTFEAARGQGEKGGRESEGPRRLLLKPAQSKSSCCGRLPPLPLLQRQAKADPASA